MGDKQRGVYEKFMVRRTDGSHRAGRKHDGCSYFVLDLTHDPYSHAALRAYAKACEREYPLLAKDIRFMLGGDSIAGLAIDVPPPRKRRGKDGTGDGE